MIDRIKKILRYQVYELQNHIWEKQKRNHEQNENHFTNWSSAPPPHEEDYSKDSHDPEKALEREYYANLELPLNANFFDIKRSYRALVKKYHPDKYHSDPKKRILAEEITAKLNTAYQHFERKNKET